MKTFTEIGEVSDQEEISAMAIDNTHACHVRSMITNGFPIGTTLLRQMRTLR